MQSDKKSKKNIFLIADRGRADVALRLGFMSSIILKKKKYDPLVVYDLKQKQEVVKIFKIFKIFNKKKIKIDRNNLFLFIFIFFKFIVSFVKISAKGFDWFVKSYEINEVKLGDLIYDKYIRNDLSYKNPSSFDIKFIYLLFKSIYQYYVVEDIFKNNKVKFSLTGSFSYISVSSLILRISQKRDIPTAYISGDGYKIFTKKTELGDPISQEIDKVIQESNLNSLRKKSEIYFNKRTKGKLKIKKYNPKLFFQHDEQNWSKIINKNYEFLKKIELLKKKYSNIVLFAPHAFSESNHLFGDIVFRDFHQQAIETLQFAKSQNKTLWLYKIHPYSQIKYGEYNSSVKTFKKYADENIMFVPMDVKTGDLFKYVDLVLSSRGTICVEAATFGLKSLITSSIFYADRKISHRVKSKKDYFKLLKNINLLKKPSKKSITKAKIVLYLRKKLQSENKYNLIVARRLVNQKVFYHNLATKLNKVDIVNNSIYSKYLEIFKNLNKNNDFKNYM